MSEAESLRFTGVNTVRWRRRELIYFSGCDYFRLARDARVAAAARTALVRHGLNVAASRMTTGNHTIYRELETALAEFFDAESALVLPDGYLAPMAVAQVLAGEFSHVLMDELAHGALVDAAKFMRCPVKKFRHRDAEDLARAARACELPIVFTDGMFAHDGSVAPLREYLRCLPADAQILVDDAHGAGVLGRNGRGTLEHAGVGRARVIQCATLSKAFGAYGGVVVGTRELREKIVSGSRIFMGTTPLPPPLAGAAIAAIRILSGSQGARQREKLFANTRRLRERLEIPGWEIAKTPGPIVRLPLKLTSVAAERMRKHFIEMGFYPPFLKYGNFPPAIRYVVSSRHPEAQLDRLAVITGFPK